MSNAWGSFDHLDSAYVKWGLDEGMETPVSRTPKYSFVVFSRAHSGALEVTVLLCPASKGQVPFL